MRLAEIMVDVGETPVFCPQHYSERWVIHIIFEGFPASLKLNAKPQNSKQPQATRASNCAVFGLVSNCECPDPGLSGPELASVNRCFGGTSGQMGMAQQCGTKQIERRLAVLFITTSKLKINWSHAKFKFHGFLTGEPGVEISKHFITFTAKHLQVTCNLQWICSEHCKHLASTRLPSLDSAKRHLWQWVANCPKHPKPSTKIGNC